MNRYWHYVCAVSAIYPAIFISVVFLPNLVIHIPGVLVLVAFAAHIIGYISIIMMTTFYRKSFSNLEKNYNIYAAVPLDNSIVANFAGFYVSMSGVVSGWQQ